MSIPLDAAGRGSETQLQMGENLNKLILLMGAVRETIITNKIRLTEIINF